MEIHQYLAANCSLRRNKCLHISFTIPLLMSAEFLVDKFGFSHSYKSVGFYYCLKQLITIACTVFALVLPLTIEPLPRWCISEKHRTKESSPQEES